MKRRSRLAETVSGWATRRSLVAALAVTGALVSSGCEGTGETYTPTPGDVAKPARACLAVDEATPLAMSPTDRRECETTMRGWYGETGYRRPDPADSYSGDAQLEYLRAKTLSCRRVADDYGLTGKERWTMLMRCLVIIRTR